MQVLNAAGYDIDTLYLAGGHVANPVLLRLYADATDCTVVLRDEADSILAGTACVAAAAAGLHPTLDASVRAATRAERRITPRPEHRQHFDAAYSQFLRMQSRHG